MLANEYKVVAYKKKFQELENLIDKKFNNGEFVVQIPYFFFSSNMEFLAYCIDELAGRGFILRLYQDRMEIHFN